MGTEKNQVEYKKRLMIGFSFVFLMTYGVVMTKMEIGAPDYPTHAEWASMITVGNIGEYVRTMIPYPLWHLVVKVLYKLGYGMAQSAAVTTASFNGLTFLVVMMLWGNRLHEKIEMEKMIFWVVCLFIVGPLYAPWINENYYMGQLVPNIWHNPTNVATKPFAVLAFGQMVLLLKGKEKEKVTYVLLALALILSVVAKPSFLQGFLPGVALFILVRLIIEKKDFNLKLYFKICMIFIPACLILLFQFFLTFYNADSILPESHQSGIGIEFGKYLHRITPNMLGSLIISFAFPLYVLVFRWKELIVKKEVQLMICYVTAAWLEAALLFEQGEAFRAGNFTWGYQIASFIVWMVMLYYYLEKLYCVENNKTLKDKCFVLGGMSLFTIHLLFGFVYWYNSFTGAILW